MYRMLGKAVALSLAGLAIFHDFGLADEKTASPPVSPPVSSPADPEVAALLAGLAQLPPEVKPGDCYVRVRQPPKYEATEERVLVKPEAIRYEVVPAEFKEVEKEIVIKPESITFEIIPAQFETKEVEVVLAPEFTTLTATEPQFQPEEHALETRAARLVVKLGEKIINPSEHTLGEVLCLVPDAAEIQVYTRNLLIKPATVKLEKVPRAVEKLATQVLVKPAEVKEVKVPAEVKKVVVRELIRPATKREIKIPAEYTTVKRQRLIEPEKVFWQRVLCATNVTPAIITAIQNKLKEKGLDPGEANGQLSDATQAAITQYQSQNSLAQAGLSYEFLEHIGIQPGQ